MNCEKCGKNFSRKSNYTSHINRKKPCIITYDNKTIEMKNNEKNNQDENKYSELSYLLTKNISKETKKNNGIYFTPPKTIKVCIEQIKPYMDTMEYILEPSCGSCEFILELKREYIDKKITGIEYNDTIYNYIKQLNSIENINIIHDDFLKFKSEKKFDLIIGNPPYFVMNKKDVDKSYYAYFEGRPNIFIIFIIKSLSILNEGGIISFILPKNFMNCLYYDKTRKFINEHFKIINILECNDKYIETEQETIILIVQNVMNSENNENNSKFIMTINQYTIFGTRENIEKIRELYVGATNLYSCGFKVSVGNIVWNQCKDILTDDITKTRLVYSSDIKNNELIMKKYSNHEKKNFIDKPGITNPVLVINRGYGVGDYTFEYGLIEGGFEYLIENHLICISYIYKTNDTENPDINKTQLIDLYKKVMKSLEDERTKKFIELYFGNNAINTTEMNYILPIYNLV